MAYPKPCPHTQKRSLQSGSLQPYLFLCFKYMFSLSAAAQSPSPSLPHCTLSLSLPPSLSLSLSQHLNLSPISSSRTQSMAPTKTYPIPKPNPSPIPNPNPGTDVEAAEPPVPKILQGARHRKSGRYVAEIRHGNRRFWLGTFCTASEAGIAYDMAALRLRGQTYNFPADANGRIITAIDPAKQDSIEKEVEKRLRSNTRSGAEDAGKRAETSNKRKQAPKSGNKKLEGQARKKREVEEKQRAKELEGFL